MIRGIRTELGYTHLFNTGEHSKIQLQEKKLRINESTFRMNSKQHEIMTSSLKRV